MSPELIADLFAAWSAAFTVWFVIAVAFGFMRLGETWHEFGWDRRVIVLGTICLCAGLAWHQGDQSYLWMMDVYSASNLRASTTGYRVFWTIGVVLLGGGLSYPRCGHKGWMFIVSSGIVCGAAAAA